MCSMGTSPSDLCLNGAMVYDMVNVIGARLTATGASLDHVDNAGRSAAHAAAENGHLPVLKFLASKDADLSRGTADRGFNVVHLASRGGHVAVLEWLNGNVPDVRTLYFQRDAKGKIPADSAANGATLPPRFNSSTYYL